MKTILLNLSVILFSLFASYSCNNEMEEQNKLIEPLQNTTAKSRPDVVNGILVFENTNQMLSILGKHETFSDEEFIKWERENCKGFTSQRTAYTNIILAENDFNEAYKNASNDFIKHKLAEKRYSDLYQTKLKSGLIRQSKDENGSTWFDYAIARPTLASIVNEDGIYVVGDTVFQITSTSEKQWIKGNLDRLSELISATESNEAKGIVVCTFPSLRASGSSETISTQGDHRIRIQMEYKTYYPNLNIIWYYYLGVGVTMEIFNKSLNKWGASYETACFTTKRSSGIKVSNPNTGQAKEIITAVYGNTICASFSSQWWRFSLLSDGTNSPTFEWYTQWIENNVAWNIQDLYLKTCEVKAQSGTYSHTAYLYY